MWFGLVRFGRICGFPWYFGLLWVGIIPVSADYLVWLVAAGYGGLVVALWMSLGVLCGLVIFDGICVV